MKRILTLTFALVVLLTSCVHQFPTSQPADVRITLTFDKEMTHYRTFIFPDETKSATSHDLYEEIFQQNFSDYENYDLRYTIEAYPVLGNGSISRDPERRWVFIEDDALSNEDLTVTLSLGEGKYEFRAWADYVNTGSLLDKFYKTDNWVDGIRVYNPKGHNGNTDWRDAFAGKSIIEVVRYGSIAESSSGVIQMHRPLGKYIFITNDLEDFTTKVIRTKTEQAALQGSTKVPEFNLDDYSLTIAYTGFMPSSYSMITDRANDSEVNVRFTSKLYQIDENRAIMGFDYVFANPDNSTQTNVIMGIELRDKDGTVLTSHNSVRVPLKRSKYTIIEGRFLLQESSGGITLNPDFDGEFIVPVN